MAKERPERERETHRERQRERERHIHTEGKGERKGERGELYCDYVDDDDDNGCNRDCHYYSYETDNDVVVD